MWKNTKTQSLLYTLLLSSTMLFASDLDANDLDNDNIKDNQDHCLNTPAGVCVTSKGCTQKIKESIYFKIDSYKVDDTNNNKTLQDIYNIAKECFGYKILITGHTDATYIENYNLTLSMKRAQTIKKYLIKHGINPKRIAIKYNGETTPTATNITKQGRSKNRRVEVVFY